MLTAEEQRILDAAIAESISQNDARVVSHNETSRFSSAIWYNKIKEQSVSLIGVGGIGSYIGFLLGRLDLNSMFIYDNDIIESANMSGQLYGIRDCGSYKVNALGVFIRNYSTTANLFTYARRFNSTDSLCRITICGFDNMAARQLVFNRWKELYKGDPLAILIDGRLNAEEFQIFCIKGDDEKAIETYQNEWLFTDKESDESVCSYKQTTYCANMIGTFMVNYFVNFIANQCNPLIERNVPFFTYYDATLGILKTKESWQQ